MERAQQDTPERPWTSRMIGVGVAALAAIALAVVLGAFVHRPSHHPLVMTAGSTSSTTSAATGPQSGAGAEAAEVQQLVSSVKPPPGAVALAGCPTVAADPAQPLPRRTAATGSRCWSVPGALRRAVTWERRHHPAHMEAAGTVRDGSVRAPTAIGLLFRLGREGGVELTDYRSGGGSVLRVDGYVLAPPSAVTSVG